MHHETIQIGEFSALRFPEISDLPHAFMGAPTDFSFEALSQGLSQRICDAFGTSNLMLVKQVHGDAIIEVSRNDLKPGEVPIILGEADAILCHVVKGGTPFAIGIRTADCLPVIMKKGEYIALVHSGWRGLAAKILTQVSSRLNFLAPEAPLTVIIGPHAGFAKYEVGEEVIEALGPKAVFKPSQNGKYLLSLEQTAIAQIVADSDTQPLIAKASICTISSQAFHSFRRDGKESGRNILIAPLSL